jgi:cobalt/nickel transport system permease protein
MNLSRITLPAALMLAAAAFLALPEKALAMHISEGILPAPWAALWFAAAAPFLYWGLRDLKKQSRELTWFKPYIGMVGAAVFIISCMPIPIPFAGTCSHPCGTGLAAILIGPTLTVVVASIALVLQALFLAHGGLTTLGADIVSMGVAGAFSGYGIFWLSRRLGASWVAAAFLAGVLSDWSTYTVTSLQLAGALAEPGAFPSLFYAIVIAFMPTQIPLGIVEGFLCMGAYRFISARRPELLNMVLRGETA